MAPIASNVMDEGEMTMVLDPAPLPVGVSQLARTPVESKSTNAHAREWRRPPPLEPADSSRVGVDQLSFRPYVAGRRCWPERESLVDSPVFTGLVSPQRIGSGAEYMALSQSARSERVGVVA